jgi:hypothetical protein
MLKATDQPQSEGGAMLESTDPRMPTEPGPTGGQGSGDGGDVAARQRLLQVLSTEHWSLLATRSLTWSESFSRASMYLSSLSAAVVALALVSQAMGTGDAFMAFALVILPVVLFIGLTTFVRLAAANGEDTLWVAAMNRIRHAYVELAPDASRYFTTGTTDDERGIMLTFSGRVATPELALVPFLAHSVTTTPGMIGTINCMVAAVLAGLVAVQLGASLQAAMVVGALAFVALFIAHLAYGARQLGGFRRMPSRFPSPVDEASRGDGPEGARPR